MKILFITDNFPPEVNAPASRTFDHCKEWVKNGADVTVVTCVPNFPIGKVYDGYKNKIRQIEYIDGIKVIRVWSYITENEGFFRRIIDYISFSFTSFFTGLFVKSDIIIATSPQFFTTVSAYFISILKRKPWVFELRDLWPESIKTVGAMSDSKLFRMIEKLELFLYRKADLIIPVTESFKVNLINRNIDGKKIHVIPNGSNVNLFTPREKNAKIINALNLKGKFVIGYIGTHGMAHSLDFIIRAIKDIVNISIHFLFIGDGAMKKCIVEFAKENKLENVTFLDSVSKSEVVEYLSVIDVSLVPLIKSDNFKTVIPSKIFESAAMEIPILLGVEGEAKRLIESYDCGICFEPENKEDLIRKINNLKDDADLLNRFKKNSSSLVKDYNREVLADKMYQIIKSEINS